MQILKWYLDSGSLAEPVIGPRFARTRWLAPRNDENALTAVLSRPE
jgi:hypothetical protein